MNGFPLNETPNNQRFYLVQTKSVLQYIAVAAESVLFPSQTSNTFSINYQTINVRVRQY